VQWNLNKLNTLFKQTNSDLLSGANDQITIYHKPVVSGNATGYSTYYGSSMDYDALFTVSGFGAQSYTATDVYGSIYWNVYSWQFSRDEQMREIPVGNIQPGDVLFIGLPSTVLLNSGNPSQGTKFDGCEFVSVAEDSNNYSVNGIFPGGMNDIAYYYVLLRKSDAQEISYT
jgi:hypothetical protein